MKEYFFEQRGIYYRVNEFRPERQTIVFVHGVSGSSSAWLPYEKDLESVYNILSFDLRGHGKSEKPRTYEEYKISDFVEDLRSLIEFLQIGKFVFVGHSMGCFVILAYLHNYQEKVSKVVLLAPNFSGNKVLSAKMLIPLIYVGATLFEKIPYSPERGKHIDYSKYPNSSDWSIPRTIADMRNTTLRAYLYTTKQWYNFDAEDFLEKIHIPTLIIHGKKDTIFPVKYGVFMASKIPSAKIVLLENADHIIALNNAQEILKEVRDFMIE